MGIETEVADFYEHLGREIGSVSTSAILDQFLHNVGLPRDWFRDKTCLDVGCGPGFAVWAMEHLGATCHACDLSYNSLRTVCEVFRDCNCQVELENASALALPYASESFDFVHCNGVLHHTIHPRQGFAELVRTTRPGGVLFVSLYGTGGLYNAGLHLGRAVAKTVPYHRAEAVVRFVLRNRRVPNSFIPAWISVLDNLYVPIRTCFREAQLRQWFIKLGFEEANIWRTQTTIYDHRKRINCLIHGEGYVQLRGHKSRKA